MILIVYCHPYVHSFNHAELVTIERRLTQLHQRFDVIDLYADHFDPTYSAHELSLYHDGKTDDPLVEKYLGLFHQASSVIFITPIWWNSVPGMLKGFIDKVMKEGSGLSHTVTRFGIHGQLQNIQDCYVLTTSTSPTFYLRYFCGNAVKHVFMNTTLKQLGFQHRHWQNFGGITTSSAKRRRRYLARLSQQRFE